MFKIITLESVYNNNYFKFSFFIKFSINVYYFIKMAINISTHKKYFSAVNKHIF